MDTQHRHQWITTPQGYGCVECPETCAACTSVRRRDGAWVTCGDPTESARMICDGCYRYARDLPGEIAEGYRHLPDVVAAIGGLHAVRHDRPGPGTVRDDGALPAGGEALALLADGNPPAVGLNTWDAQAQQDPIPVVTFLTAWEDEWRRAKGDPIPQTTNLKSTMAYLESHTLWAAQMLDADVWAAWVQQASAQRSRIARLTGTAQPPVVEAVPCHYCNGALLRKWREDGLSDIRECQRCGRWYTPNMFIQAQRSRLSMAADHDPRVLVVESDAVRIFAGRLASGTLRQWVRRGKIEVLCTTQDDQALYRIGDIATVLDQSDARDPRALMVEAALLRAFAGRLRRRQLHRWVRDGRVPVLCTTMDDEPLYRVGDVQAALEGGGGATVGEETCRGSVG